MKALAAIEQAHRLWPKRILKHTSRIYFSSRLALRNIEIVNGA
jgi:hypothetical protein